MAKMNKRELPVPARNMLTEAEQEERQRNYLTRLEDVIATCANFKNFLAHFKEMEGERAERESWEQYITCSGLPDPKSPSDIRTFLSKLRYYEDIETANTTDGTLSVDERSVLTQNIFQQDLTRKTVGKTKCSSPGPYFEVSLRNCLEVLRQLDVLKDNQVGIERIDPRTQSEIHSVYGEVQREIEMLFDRLTYRVLAMQKMTMKSVNGIVGMWSHSADRWRMDLWGLLNVPIIFEQMEFPAMIAELPVTGVRVQMPLSILTDRLTLRCVHTSFDHHSQDAKSYEHAAIDHNSVSSAGIADMEKSVITEWQILQTIQEEVLLSMQHKRQEYEDLMMLIAERTERAAKNAKSDKDQKEKIVIPKTPKEVRAVPPGLVPDVYDDFISREKVYYEEYMDNNFHPKLLDILPNEINLREHIIVGGIYSLVFVEVPSQTQFQKFNIVLHHDRRVLRIIPDVVVEKHLFSGSVRSSKSLNESLVLDENELPYFNVTVKLPPDLCRWGKPRVCHFLTEQQRVLRMVNPALKPSAYVSHGGSKDPSSENISAVYRNSSIKSNWLPGVRYEEQTGDQIDFSLDKILDKDEARSMAAQCLPRIISSFKFPLDLNEKEDDELTPKLKRTHLLKRSDTTFVKEDALPKDNFDYSVQNQPERMFPKFPNALPAQIPHDESCNKNTASDVIGAFSTIQRQYEERPLNILQQVEPSSKKDKKLDRTESTREFSNWQDAVSTTSKRTSVIKAFRKAKKLDDPDGAMGRNSRQDRVSEARSLFKKNNGPDRSGRTSERTSWQENVSINSKKSIDSRAASSKNTHERRSHRMVKKVPSAPASPPPKAPVIAVTHWTTMYIYDERFDPETNTLTFRTDRLGMFGMAFKRYEHFPFGEWCLQTNEDNPDEVTFSLNTHHVSMFLFITSQGVRGYVTDLTKGYVAHPVKYLEIKEPVSDFRQLRQILVDKNLNIFPGKDAGFYITNGYHSIKHLATEMHTYNTMALHCKSMKFYRSSWNRLADRRDIIMDMKVAKDTSDFTEVTLRITPEKTTFVKVSEMCSDNVNNVNLQYEETWRNVNNYMDLNSAIGSMNPTALETCSKTPMLFINIKRLLTAIRPLSFA